MKKKIIWVLVVTALAVSAVLAGKYRQSAAQPSAAGANMCAARRGPIMQAVECTGSVVSNLDVEIKCKASGQVIRLPYDVSDPVKKGDLIIEIDPVDQERALQQAQANLEASTARIAQAQATLDASKKSLASSRQRAVAQARSAEARHRDADAKAKRERELLERRQSSVEEAETAETAAKQAAQDLEVARAELVAVEASELELDARRQDIALAQAQVRSDEIALAIAEERLRDTKVAAPIDGVVSGRLIQVGQIIASGINNIGGGTTAMTLSDLSRMFVLASVDESDIGHVALGQEARITADAFPGQTFRGEVVRVAASGENVSNVITFEVRIEVLSDNKVLLKPGMTANIEIVIATRDDAILVPSRALVRKSGNYYVNRIADNAVGAELHPVEIGLVGSEDAEVTAGLREGDRVQLTTSTEGSSWNPDRQRGRGMPPPPM